MESSIPSWLDVPFLEHVLKSVEGSKQDVQVADFRCTPAVPPGTNYLSTVHRVVVDYKTPPAGAIKSLSLIVKQPLESGNLKDAVEEGKGYETEFKAYSELLPKLYELHSSRVTPRSFLGPLENWLVLEDLRPSGYRVADRLKQLDLPHCRLFFQSVAKLHALSIEAFSRNPELIGSVGNHLFYNDRVTEKHKKQMQGMCAGFLRAVVNTVENLNGCEKYAEKIRSKISTSWRNMVKLVKPGSGMNVLNHGDPWTVNIMFKYNNAGEPVDLKLVDFQFSQYCSFSHDLIFFWWSSADESVRGNHRDELFELYRDTLNQTLEEIHCSKRLSKEDFDQEMKANASYALFIVAHILPFAMSDPEDLLDYKGSSPDDFDSPIDDSPKWKNFRSKYYKAVLPKTLRELEEFGVFD